MTRQVILDETNKLMDRCYTKGSPDYPDLMVFQRQKFLNELFPLLDRLGVVRKADSQTLWFLEASEAYRKGAQAVIDGGYVKVESLICPCKKEPCECPSINRGSFAKYVEEEV